MITAHYQRCTNLPKSIGDRLNVAPIKHIFVASFKVLSLTSRYSFIYDVFGKPAEGMTVTEALTCINAKNFQFINTVNGMLHSSKTTNTFFYPVA